MAKQSTSKGTALAVVEAAQVPTFNPAIFAASLVQACDANGEEITAIQAAAAQEIIGRERNFLARLKDLSSQVAFISEESWDSSIKPIIVADYTGRGYKNASTRASMLKMCVMAFAHNIDCPREVTSMSKFVNEIARKALKAAGVVAEKNSGRKGGAADKVEVSTKSVAKVNDLQAAALLLAKQDAKACKQVHLEERTAAILYLTSTNDGWAAIIDLAVEARKSQA